MTTQSLHKDYFVRKHMLKTGILLVTLLMAAPTWAFGVAQNIVGDVTVLSLEGEARPLVKGERIALHETVVTAGDSEVLVKMDDQGLLLLKANSKLLIQLFKKSAKQNIFIAVLSRGSLQGEAATISTTKSSQHRITTPYGKVFLDNAQYEISLATHSNKPATFVKVNKGQGKLSTRGISVNLKPNDLAKSTTGEAPQLLVIEPDHLFAESKLTGALQQASKKNAQRQATKASVAEGKVAGNCAGDNPAQKVLDQFINAYERGDVAYIQRRLDPSMIGYGALLNGMMKDVSAQKQIRFLIQNKNVQCGPDLAVVNFTWEKRFLDLVTFRPRLQTGQAAVLTHLKAGEWKLSGISGDNPFASKLSKPTTLIATPKAISLNVAGLVSIPSQIRLISEDLEGAGVVQVEAVASNGDRETFTLAEVQPGVFVKNDFNALDNGPFLNDGLITALTNATTVVTFSYKNLRTGLIASDTISITDL